MALAYNVDSQIKFVLDNGDVKYYYKYDADGNVWLEGRVESGNLVIYQDGAAVESFSACDGITNLAAVSLNDILVIINTWIYDGGLPPTAVTGSGTDTYIVRWDGSTGLEDADWAVTDAGALYPVTAGNTIGTSAKPTGDINTQGDLVITDNSQVGTITTETLSATRTWTIPNYTGEFVLAKSINNNGVVYLDSSGEGTSVAGFNFDGTNLQIAGNYELVNSTYTASITPETLTAARTWTAPNYTGEFVLAKSINNNGVVYLDSSGEGTSASAFNFDGTNLQIAGNYEIVNSTYIGSLTTTTLTAARTWTFPNNTGTVALTTDYTWAAVLANGATSGGTDATISAGDTLFIADTGILTLKDASFDGSFATATLTAARTWTFPDNTGTLALTTDYTLANVLINGNVTGANDISVDTGQVIKATTGGGELNLSDGGADIVSLSTDNGALAEGWHYADTTTASIGFNDTYLEIGNDYVTSVFGAAINTGVYSFGIGFIQAATKVGWDLGLSINTLLFYDNTSTSISSVDSDSKAMIANSRNSTINSGVTNTVVVSGVDITAKTDDTLYTNRISLQPDSNTNDGLLVPPALSADRTWTFPDTTGTVALTSSYTLATVLSNGNTTGGTDIEITSGDTIDYNVGSGGSLASASTTGIRTWTLPDSTGTLAITTDYTLAAVLANGTTSGGNNMTISAGDTFTITDGTTNGIFYDNGTSVVNSANLTYDGTDVTITSGDLYADNKFFRIPHQGEREKGSKDAWLVYSVIEGPEAAVYFRGKTRDKRVKLPEEWGWLVDEDSITAQVTPVGDFAQVCYEVENDYLILYSDKDIEFSYVVYGERKDRGKLETTQYGN